MPTENSYKISTKRNNLFLRVSRGHFATNHSHINYYIDVTTQKTRLSEAQAVAEELVSYYTEQTKARYSYYAEKNDMEYSKVLEDFGATEESIATEAKALAKADLVFAALVKAESITLSDSEKSEHFGRYLEFYVESYGYTEEYVKENLTDEIYESMLYDKASEFLIINNSFPE